MSNGNGISFVHDLVAMATAADKVPQLEEQINELRKALDAQTASNWELEAKIIDHTNAHGETKARLHNAEVARDDAELRFLESDDAKLAAVRAMRVVIGEAEAFIKAVTPTEEVIKPDYTDKWLWDVQGWSGISLNQWLENGGSTARFVAVKVYESQRATDPTQVVTETSALGVPGGIVSDLGQTQLGVENEVGPTASTLGSGQVPSSNVPCGLAASEGSASTITVEGECAPNPTVETLTGSIGETAQSQPADGSSAVGTEGDSADPFASTTITESETVSSLGAEAKENAPTNASPNSDDDLWAIPSRASHYSS